MRVKRGQTDLSSRSIEELKAELQALPSPAEHLQTLASIWQHLQWSGQVDDLPLTGLAAFLPGIAEGKADAKAVCYFAGSPVLRAMSGLSITQQRALGRGWPVCVAREILRPDQLADTESALDEVLIDPLRLTVAQIRLVFGASGIRSPQEQRAERARSQARRAQAEVSQ